MSGINIYWVSEDGQSSMHGGEYATAEAAFDDIACFKKMLLDECADDNQRAGILAGRFVVEDEL